MDPTSLLFALLAGVLSTLSPCVLPLLPAILTGASMQHRLGPLALAGGLALTFAGISLFVATIGFSLGLNGDLFRIIGGLLMLIVGGVLLVPAAQTQWAIAAGPLQAWTESRFGGLSTTGFRGQFGLGLLLGVVWAPCVGPTLGAASLMAARGENLAAVTVITLIFAIGAALPLLLLGILSRQAWTRWAKHLGKGGTHGKRILGLILVAFGVLILTGLDKGLQTYLVSVSPEWLTALTTRF